MPTPSPPASRELCDAPSASKRGMPATMGHRSWTCPATRPPPSLGLGPWQPWERGTRIQWLLPHHLATGAWSLDVRRKGASHKGTLRRHTPRDPHIYFTSPHHLVDTRSGYQDTGPPGPNLLHLRKALPSDQFPLRHRHRTWFPWRHNEHHGEVTSRPVPELHHSPTIFSNPHAIPCGAMARRLGPLGTVGRY